MASSIGGKTDVSILICTYARASLLRKTLLSLAQVRGIETAEIIVIDNHSPDDTADTVAQCAEQLAHSVDIRYVFEPQQGLSIARNRGIAESVGAIIAFLDDDAVPSPDWLHSLRKAFAAYPDAAAVGGVIAPHFEIDKPDWLIKPLEHSFTIVHYGYRERKYPGNGHPFGANMALRRSSLRSLRFPESLGRKGKLLLSGEETWLFGELRRQGYALYYIPEMSVTHFIPKERLTPSWVKERYYCQGATYAIGSGTLPLRVRLLLRLLLRCGYLLLSSLGNRTAGQRLVQECRLASIRGAWDTLRHPDAVLER